MPLLGAHIHSAYALCIRTPRDSDGDGDVEDHWLSRTKTRTQMLAAGEFRGIEKSAQLTMGADCWDADFISKAGAFKGKHSPSHSHHRHRRCQEAARPQMSGNGKLNGWSPASALAYFVEKL
jgi:hypothetical protein